MDHDKNICLIIATLDDTAWASSICNAKMSLSLITAQKREREEQAGKCERVHSNSMNCQWQKQSSNPVCHSITCWCRLWERDTNTFKCIITASYEWQRNSQTAQLRRNLFPCVYVCVSVSVQMQNRMMFSCRSGQNDYLFDEKACRGFAVVWRREDFKLSRGDCDCQAQDQAIISLNLC